MPAGPTLVIGLMVIGQLIILGWLLSRRPPLLVTLLVLFVATCSMKLGVSMAQSEPSGLTLARETVRNPHIGGFFTVATVLHETEWYMEDYAGMMRQFPLHALNKPPGPTTFWLAMLQWTDSPDSALTLGVLLIAVIASLAPPLMLLWAFQLDASPVAAISAGALLSLFTGSVAFFPLFDPCYTSVALLLLISWTVALKRGSLAAAAGFGLLLAGTLFTSFHVLPIGVVLAGLAVFLVEGTWMHRLKQIGRLSLTGLIACVFGLALLRFFAGYDVMSVFKAALENQHAIMAMHGEAGRPYPATIGWDLYDLALGTGFVPVLLAILFLFRRDPHHHTLRKINAVGLTLLLFIAATALLPGETARVWNFLFPLIALPAGTLIGNLSSRERLVILASVVLTLVVTLHALTFVSFDAPVIH